MAQATRPDILLRKYGFNARIIPVGFVVEEVALKFCGGGSCTEVFLRVLRGYLVSIILSVLLTQPFIYYQRYIFLKFNSAIKK